MSDVEVFQRLGLALAVGLLIGLERGWQSVARRRGPGRRQGTLDF